MPGTCWTKSISAENGGLGGKTVCKVMVGVRMYQMDQKIQCKPLDYNYGSRVKERSVESVQRSAGVKE